MSKLFKTMLVILLLASCEARLMKGSVVTSSRDAAAKCPNSCAMRNAVWTGRSPKFPDGKNYCACDTATQPIPEAFNVYNTPLPHGDANHPTQAEYVVVYPERSIPALSNPARFCAAICKKKHAIWMNGPLSIRRFGRQSRCVCRYPLMDYESHNPGLQILGHVPRGVPPQQFCPSLCHSHRLNWNKQTTKVVSGNAFYEKCNCQR